VPELEVTEVFEWKNLKMISIQCQESYDDISDNAKLVGIGMVVFLVWFALLITQDSNPEIL